MEQDSWNPQLEEARNDVIQSLRAAGTALIRLDSLRPHPAAEQGFPPPEELPRWEVSLNVTVTVLSDTIEHAGSTAYQAAHDRFPGAAVEVEDINPVSDGLSTGTEAES